PSVFGNAYAGEVVPAFVDLVNNVALRQPNPDRPIVSRGKFSLWGIAPEVVGFNPSPLLTDQSRAIERESRIVERIQPEAYQLLLTPEQVVFEVLRKDPKTQADTAVLTASGDDPGGFRVPRGLSVKDGVYTARLRVNGVQLQGSVQSPQVPLPVCPLVGLKTPIVTLELVRDPANDRTCGEPAKLRFSLCLDSRVTILVDGRPLVAAVDGAPQNV